MTDLPGDDRLDLDAYLARIGYQGPRRADLETLVGVHQAHALSVPFENLDILLGRPIRLDLGSIQAKLVRGGRGGYCFEQNRLLAAALEALGFAVQPLGARVRYRATRTLPRTHMALLVEAEGRPYLADVGFGAAGPIRPLPMVRGIEADQHGWAYRIAPADGDWSVLQVRRGEAWADLYAFDLTPQEPADYEMASYYVSTHPDSPFTRGPILQRTTIEARYGLRSGEFTVDRGGEDVTSRPITDDEWPALLGEVFGLHMLAGTKFGG